MLLSSVSDTATSLGRELSNWLNDMDFSGKKELSACLKRV